MQFDKINIEYLIAVASLGSALILGIVYGERELASNIASGLVGYLSGRGIGAVIAAKKDGEKRE